MYYNNNTFNIRANNPSLYCFQETSKVTIQAKVIKR